MRTAELEHVTHMRVEYYDPRLVVEAVNALLPLGKSAALEEVGAQQPEPPDSGLFWVLRVLFDVPDPPGFPAVALGTPLIPPPGDPARLPRYPIAIVRDVPLFVAGGYVLRGLPEPVQAHIDYYRQHGSLRAQPLQPAGSPSEIQSDLRELWMSAYGPDHLERMLAAVSAQIARTG